MKWIVCRAKCNMTQLSTGHTRAYYSGRKNTFWREKNCGSTYFTYIIANFHALIFDYKYCSHFFQMREEKILMKLMLLYFHIHFIVHTAKSVF